ncbi:E4F1 [Mytilus coruscus]|uniref:E4F1 n=1 Tax=Mytilus coruscus TaxID=42192 RepID=A0A6J8CHL5_MYTCO|nr:E4F1 [Mytilus coruscus]
MDEIKDTKDVLQFRLEVIDAKLDKYLGNQTHPCNLIKGNRLPPANEEKELMELDKEHILNHIEPVNKTFLNGPKSDVNFYEKETFKVKRGTINNHILEHNNNDKIECRQNETPSNSEFSTDEVRLQVPEIPKDVKGVYTVAQMELKITYVKAQVREVHDCSFKRTETFNVIEHPDVTRFYKELKGFLLYISVLSWYTRWLFEHAILYGSGLPESVQLDPVAEQHKVGSTPTSEVTDMESTQKVKHIADKDIKDTFKCGRCKEKFQSLDSFVNHKIANTCKQRSDDKEKEMTQSDVDSKDQTTQFRYTMKTDDVHLMNDIEKIIKENPDKLTIMNGSKDFYEKGSLVLWGKMPTSLTKNRESVKAYMEAFVVNMLENCPHQSDEEATVTVKLDVLKEIEGCEDDDDDVLCCGRCNKLFNRIEAFSSHKKECNRKARCLKTSRATGWLPDEVSTSAN